MRVLIDIGHPAHVHYFRNLASELSQKGHTVFWTVKDMQTAKDLLHHYGFHFRVLPKKTDSLIGKILNQFRYNFLLYKICRREKINFAIGSSAGIVHVSRLLNVKSILFDDDDDKVQPLVARFVNPFAHMILSPDAIRSKPKRSILYPGYQELAYLHPNRFSPDPEVLREAGLAPGEKFFILRFNAFKAHHDVGVRGLDLSQKLKLIEVLSPHGKIFITAERTIEPELEQFRLKVRPEKIHSLMAYATLFLGDSQTMTSEAAVLGVPALKCNTFAGKLSVPNELENKYGLCFSYLPEQFEEMLNKLNELLAMQNLKEEWQKRRESMLKEKMDVTGFYAWFLENFPESAEKIRKNPETYQSFR